MNYNYFSLCLFGISACFIADIVSHEAIVGGYTAEYPDLLYQASILRDGNEIAPTCGGGIISDVAVLTAAHCVINEHLQLIGQKIFVLVRTYDLAISGVVSQVDRVFVPTDYNPQDAVGDIAILLVANAFDLRFNLTVLQIPKVKSRTYENANARIAGFGWDKMYENMTIGENTDTKLRYLDANVFGYDQCHHLHPHRRINQKHLCARVIQRLNHRRGACIGDTGGPLVDNSVYRHIVIGVLSVIDHNCTEAESSGIYTRVSYYRFFIHNVLRQNVTRNMRVYNITI